MLLVVVVALAACEREELPTVRGDPLPPEPEAFDDPVELLEAVEEGTFAEAAGLTEEIAAAVRPEPPPPRRIDFVRGTQVPEDQIASLQQLAERLRQEPGLRIDVIGCSDPSGPEDLNLRISQSRAESVVAQLRSLGVSGQQIDEVVGRGESCSVQERFVRIVPKLPDGGGAAPSGV